MTLNELIMTVIILGIPLLIIVALIKFIFKR